jgi:hypothetical protein
MNSSKPHRILQVFACGDRLLSINSSRTQPTKKMTGQEKVSEKRNVTVAILVAIVVVGVLIGLTQGQRILNAFGLWAPSPCEANC